MPSKKTPSKKSATSKHFPILKLDQWVKKNWKDLKPPVSNKELFPGSDDAIVFVSGGPNTRNDYHVNPTEELFYQLKGDIAVRIRPLDGSTPRDVVIKEGEVYLLPRWVPHRPQRPSGTVGLIVEFPRPRGMNDGLRWYCPKCDHLVHEASFRLKKIDKDLHVIMNKFWGGPAAKRTCRNCGHTITRAGEIELKHGKIQAKASRSASKTGDKKKVAKRRTRGTKAKRAQLRV